MHNGRGSMYDGEWVKAESIWLDMSWGERVEVARPLDEGALSCTLRPLSAYHLNGSL